MSSSENGVIPRTDAGMLLFAQNASTKVSLAPTTYGLTTGFATTLASATSGFQAAIAACDPFARNKTAVIAKRTAKATLLAQLTSMVELVRGDLALSDETRSELGIPPRATPTPIPVPSEVPSLDILATVGKTIKIRVHGSDTARRGKPANCAGFQLYSCIGPAPASDDRDWFFEGSGTRPLFTVTVPDSVEAGSQIWFKACWFNNRQQCGDAGSPVSTFVQFTSTSQAA